jgi:catechol 2,3-dioxygenase-like lactoylglutathione lyase family enzyme
MAYRFVLDVPEALHESAKAAVGTAPGAMVLIERRPNPTSAEGSRAELSVTAHTLDVIDVVYGWLAETDAAAASDVYLEAYKGGRFPLIEHDPKALRRLIQGNQYWYENTMPNVHYLDAGMMEGGAMVADVPYGGRTASGLAVAEAVNDVTLGAVDHVAVRVRNPYQAETFYRDFFGMSVSYRARRDDDRWDILPADYDWTDRFATGVEPDIIRMENGPVSLVLINAGAAAVLMEARVAYISVSAPIETLNELRGRALFASYTLQEDSPRAFRFIDPFGVSWQIVAQ